MDRGKVGQHAFVVRSNERVAEGVWRMTIESDMALCIHPGQFMDLAVPGNAAHILRLPLSFARSSAEERTVELEFAVVGEGTARLSHMEPGDESVLTGPCGRGWWLPDVEPSDGKALLVAGGIGLPPIEAAAGMLHEAGHAFDVVVGARSKDVLIADRIAWLRELVGDGEVVVCTDDGSAGYAGYTIGALEDLLERSSAHYLVAYACGPQIMLAGIAREMRERGIACQVSMERMMGCGFGACSCCNVELAAGGYALCCQDGPVFDAREVAW
jgi:dihydroorotate dehydrogenase electron transfer subunit